MKLIAKSFRFTEEDITRLDDLKTKLGLKKDIEVLRHLLIGGHASENKAVILKSGKQVAVDEEGFALPEDKSLVSKKNAYDGYEIMPNPDGRMEPWYSDSEMCKVLWIMEAKSPFRKVMLKADDPEWSLFAN